MKKLTFLILSLLGVVLAQNKPNTIALRPIQTDTDSVFVINSSKDLYYIKVKTNTGAILGAVNLAMNPTTGNLSLTVGGATYVANLGTQNDFETATYNSATGEITLTANDGTNTVLTIDGSETKLTGGAGVAVTGNGTSATPYNVEALDISPTNELQTLGLSGNVLSISGANSLTLPNTSPVLVASNDLFISGGNLQTGAPLVQNTETDMQGFSRSFKGGNFGIGTVSPQNVLEVGTGTPNTSGVRLTDLTNASPYGIEEKYLSVDVNGDIVIGGKVDLCDLMQDLTQSQPYQVGDKAVFMGMGTSTIPPTWVGYEFDWTAIFASCPTLTNVSDFYFTDFQHCGQSTPEDPISVIDQLAVQTFIDNVLIPDLIVCGVSVSVGDIIYTVNPGDVIVVWYNPSYIITDNNWVFGDVAGDGCIKEFPSISTSLPPSTSTGCYLAEIPSLSSMAARLNARAYTAPDSALFWNGDSLYLDDFSSLILANSEKDSSTFNKVGTLLPSDDISDDVYHTGKVAIGDNTPGIATLKVGGGNFLAANTPKASQWISDNGGRLYIGDNGAADGVTAHNISIGEFGGSDTDILQLHAKLGVNITGNNGTSGPDVVNVRVATNGNVGIGNTNPLNKLHIGSAFVPNTGGIRLPITSASPVQTGQAIGVDVNGDIVVVAASTGGGGITSLGGQTGLTQTLSVTNTTAARAWTSAADNHSLNLRAWDLNGNAGTNQATNFVGTTDAVDLAFRTSNTERMRIYQNGGVGIGTTTPAAKVLGSELSVQTGGFTRVSATHTTTGTTGRSEFFAGTSTASGFGAFGYANAGFASPFTGVATAYSYVALSVATDLLIGQNGNAQPMWEFKATTGNTGIGTNNPQVKLDVNGGIATEVRTVTVSGTLVVSDHVCLINNGAAAFTATLPAAASFQGRHIIVKRIDNTSTGAITINTAGGSVQALAGTLGATTSLAAIGTYGQAAHFISNGTNWYRIN